MAPFTAVHIIPQTGRGCSPVWSGPGVIHRAAVNVNIETERHATATIIINSFLTSSCRPAALCSRGWPVTAATLGSAWGCQGSPERGYSESKKKSSRKLKAQHEQQLTSCVPSTPKLTAAVAVMSSFIVNCWGFIHTAGSGLTLFVRWCSHSRHQADILNTKGQIDDVTPASKRQDFNDSTCPLAPPAG